MFPNVKIYIELLDSILFVKSCNLLVQQYLYELDFISDQTSKRFFNSAKLHTSAPIIGGREAVKKIASELIEHEKRITVDGKILLIETLNLLNEVYEKLKEEPSIRIKDKKEIVEEKQGRNLKM